MKRLFLFLPLLLGACSPSLVHFAEDEHYVNVFDIPGTKNELYLKAHNWMIETFNSAESVIQHSDKDEGVVIGKYLMYGSISSGMYGSVDTRVYAIIDIRVKDDKARLEIKPQGQWQYDASGMTVYQFSKDDAIRAINRLADSFEQGMAKQSIEF